MHQSDAVRNARANAFESTIGTAPKIRILTGTVEASAAATETGSLLAQVTCPSDWLGAASSGVKTIAGGPWAFTGVGDGTAGHYRLVDTAGTTCHANGPVSATGGAGELKLDNVVIAVDQVGSITAFTYSEGNA